MHVRRMNPWFWKNVPARTALVLFGMALMILAAHRNHSDEVTLVAHGMVIDLLSDADEVARLEKETGENVRDQISVEEMTAINEEVRLINMGNQRN